MKVLISLVLILIAAISVYGTQAAFQRMDKPSTLPAPSRQLEPSMENLGPVMVKIETKDTQPVPETSVKITYENAPNLRKHIETTSIQKGWFPYKTGSDGIHLIMPRKDLPELDLIKADPIGWAVKENATIDPARGPSNLDLVKAQLNIEQTGEAAQAAWVTLFITSLISIVISSQVLAAYWLSLVLENS